ncbi:DUF1648 domain-containing protein [Agrococcus sp. TF02-05]|uniref:DUF1648 domain-containing protein n=1 Tax=Agrococcus sp. TF02-05 TaxID=2815211 RepID=UPI001AA1CD43|nr:DUF1648 domain-containing protein [Agrococcus sp. TF02-05]MBO1769523.1 DUF1648 domain-containing protein [Agrococcus sp. TF02-05]
MTPSATPRPPRTYGTGAVTRALRILAFLCIAAITAWLLLRYHALPETIPTHFDATGEADAFGSRSNVLALAGVMVALAALLAWLSTKPRHLNYLAHLTDENAQRVYREGERLLVWLLATLVPIYLGLLLSMLGCPGAALVVGGLAAMPVLVLVGAVRMAMASTPRA